MKENQDHNIQNVYRQIVEISKKYQVKNVVLFGSRARGTNMPKSDIDLAIYGCADFGGLSDSLNEDLWSLLKLDIINMDDKYVSSELISEIEILNDQHHILDMLKAIRTVIDNDADKVPDKKGYYILQLNYETHMLTRWFFKPSELDKANAMYDALEKKRDGAPLDIVMVRAASYSTVKDAYPNYFMDIGEFVDLISEYLK